MDLPLPLDICLDMLSRLPIKSLIRCKSVSKAFNFLSSHPLLPNMHLARASSSSQYLILFTKPTYNRTKTHLYFLDYENQSPTQYLIKLNLPYRVWLHNFTILGSCNGLLCLFEVSSHTNDMYVYNPSTSGYFQLPHFEISPYSVAMGFGFDCKAEKYKAVRVITDSISSCSPVIQVYTLGSSNWRNHSIKMDTLWFIDPTSPGVYLNGALHWKGYKKADNVYSICIVSFDLGTEELGIFPFPHLFSNLYASLVALGDCISLFHSVFHELYGFCIGIWVMKTYGVKESWTKEFMVNDSPLFKSGIKNAKPLSINEKGEIIFICGGRQLVAYDPTSKNYRDLGFFNPSDEFVAISHCGSLIPIGL